MGTRGTRRAPSEGRGRRHPTQAELGWGTRRHAPLRLLALHRQPKPRQLQLHWLPVLVQESAAESLLIQQAYHSDNRALVVEQCMWADAILDEGPIRGDGEG